MRYKSIMLASLCLSAIAHAQEPKAYQSGQLLQMDSIRCSAGVKDAKTFADEAAPGTNNSSGSKKVKEFVCREYLLQGDQVVYRIRPKSVKHPVLLPVGEWAQFRLEQDKMLVRVWGSDSKDLEYIVVSITARGGSADVRPVRLNHLQ